MVTAIISGLATRHSSSIEIPPDANVTEGQDLVDQQQAGRLQNQTVELPEAVLELQDGEGENWPNQEDLNEPGVTVAVTVGEGLEPVEAEEVTGGGDEVWVELEEQQMLDDQPELSLPVEK